MKKFETLEWVIGIGGEVMKEEYSKTESKMGCSMVHTYKSDDRCMHNEITIVAVYIQYNTVQHNSKQAESQGSTEYTTINPSVVTFYWHPSLDHHMTKLEARQYLQGPSQGLDSIREYTYAYMFDHNCVTRQGSKVVELSLDHNGSND